MHVCIADNSNLIDPASRAVCCAADKKRIRIVVLKCETAVRIWESRHCAQADARVVIGKGEDYLRRIRSHAVCYGPKRRMTCSNLKCFSNRSRFTERRGQSSYRRSCPHGKRANDRRRCEEQNGRESVEVRFHRIFLVLGFSVYICVGTLFGGRTNVFLLGKSGNRGQNPPSFCRRPTKSRSISRCEFSEGKQTVQLQIRAVARDLRQSRLRGFSVHMKGGWDRSF